MSKIIKISFISLLLTALIPVTIFAAWSNTAKITYYRNGYSWGWNYGLNSIVRENTATGSSVYGMVTYSNKTSWTNPSCTIVNTYTTYRTNSISLQNSSGLNVRLYNMSAPKGESTNLLIKGHDLQTGADTIDISFTPY